MDGHLIFFSIALLMFCGIFLFFVPIGNLIRYYFRIGKDDVFRIGPIFYTVECHVYFYYLFIYVYWWPIGFVVLEKVDAISSEAGTAYTSGALEVTTVFCGVRVALSLLFCVQWFLDPCLSRICKKHYIDCLRLELGLDSSLGNPSYTAITLSKEEIIDNHMSVLSSFGIFHERWRLWSTLTVLGTTITQLSIQTTLYHRICQGF